VTTSNDGTDNSSAEICVAKPVIHIAKTADKAQVNAGDGIGFTMTVWNTGNGDASNTSLSDPLPTNPGLDCMIADQGYGWDRPSLFIQDLRDCGPVKMPLGTTQTKSSFTLYHTSTPDNSTGGPCDDSCCPVDTTELVTTSNDGSDNSTAEICVAKPVIH